jgi:hypothetical protein
MKEIFHRICEYEKCKKPFDTKLKNKFYCGQKCVSAAWREKHPREFKGRNWESQRICGNDNISRDTPEKWLKYVKSNPIYYESLGKFTNRFNQKAEEV